MTRILFWIGIAVGAWLLLILVLILIGKRQAARFAARIIPDTVRLFKGMLRDDRVPISAKIVLLLALAWILSPIDLIPEFIPIAGPLDDVIVAALALRFALRRTPPEVAQVHWHGDPRTLDRLLGRAAQ